MDFSALQQHLGVTFVDQNLIKQALIHRSYLNENREWRFGHNERLEFLGDAVLELIVKEFLFKNYPREEEGLLTAYRSGLVNNALLANIAIELGLNDFLLTSKGEAKSTDSRARAHMLANAFESIVGALYLDQGYESAKTFVARFLLLKARKIIEDGLWQDAKSLLQECAQKHLGITPTYETLKVSGPQHDSRFTSGVYFGSTFIAQGKGRSKKLAETNAAKTALALQGWG